MADRAASVPIPRPRRLTPMSPFRAVLGWIGYLGGAGLLAGSTIRACLGSRPGEPSFYVATSAQVDRLVRLGFPMVAMVHVGMGSFLAMQAYFGATFVDGIGPVVGVGLIRNLAPLLSGFLLAGLVSARYVADLRSIDPAEGARLAASRVMAAAIAGPILATGGAAVGIAIGWLVALQMMGVTWPAFFDLFTEMLWARDVVGLVIKGVGFGGVAAVLACHEGLRRPEESDDRPDAIGSAACRATCLGMFAILVLNSGWFLLVYHAGAAFGPTVLTPPNG